MTVSYRIRIRLLHKHLIKSTSNCTGLNACELKIKVVEPDLIEPASSIVIETKNDRTWSHADNPKINAVIVSDWGAMSSIETCISCCQWMSRLSLHYIRVQGINKSSHQRNIGKKALELHQTLLKYTHGRAVLENALETLPCAMKLSLPTASWNLAISLARIHQLLSQARGTCKSAGIWP